MTNLPAPSAAEPDPAPRIAPAVLALIILTCLPELILLAADYGIIGSARWRPLAYQYGAFWAGIWHGWTPNYAAQAWTMSLTYALLHGGPGHLAGNMATLLGLGRIVVDRAGQSRFLLLYLISTLGGALAFGLMTISPSPMVGASGALFGLALGFLLAMIVELVGRPLRSPAQIEGLGLPVLGIVPNFKDRSQRKTWLRFKRRDLQVG